MKAKLARTLVGAGFASLLMPQAAALACSDRPGTPTNVSARVTSQNPPIIQVSWTNTATERVWWDVEMTDERGTIFPLPAGVGRGDQGKGLRVSNSYTVEPGVTRCFRIKARTEAKTEGCVSAIWSGRTCVTVPNPFHHGTETCKSGFVWRLARSNDLVCVTPQTRTDVARDNRLAAQRRQPGGGAFGPNTCKPGFVWREAFDGDTVCVPPDVRTKTKQDNALAAQRRVRG